MYRGIYVINKIQFIKDYNINQIQVFSLNIFNYTDSKVTSKHDNQHWDKHLKLVYQ